MDAQKEIAHQVADLICKHKTELGRLILDAYDKRYTYSKGSTLPQEVRDSWVSTTIDSIVNDLRGAPNPFAYEICGGDMVLQCEKSINSYVTYLESELFCARVISAFLWRYWVADPAAIKAGINALEASVCAAIRTNSQSFVDELCTPGTISTILNLRTPSGPSPSMPTLETAQPNVSKESVNTPAYTELTYREREILDLVVEGLSNKMIATRLGVSLSTVKNHIGRIFDKYGVQSRAGLVALVLRDQAAPVSTNPLA